MAMNGNNIIVYQLVDNSWVAIAATKSDEIQVDDEMIEIPSTTQADQGWKCYIAGRKSWSLNVSWLVTTVADIRKVLLVGTRVKLHIGARGWDGTTEGGLTGFAYIKTCKATLTRNSLANGSFAFIGDGALT